MWLRWQRLPDHVAIAAEGIDVIIKDLKSRLVVMGCEPRGGYGHTDAVSDTLTERSGRSFDVCGPAASRMSGGFAVQLAELLDVIEGDGEIALCVRILDLTLRTSVKKSMA